MPILLAYRRDLLAARGLAAPETWAQMLDMAALLNGTDMNGDGVGDYALCVDVDPSKALPTLCVCLSPPSFRLSFLPFLSPFLLPFLPCLLLRSVCWSSCWGLALAL